MAMPVFRLQCRGNCNGWTSFLSARIAKLVKRSRRFVISKALEIGRLRPRNRRQPGLTILELLVAVASLVALLALLLPAIQSAREASRNMKCLSNLHQLGVALHAFEQSHASLPPGWTQDASGQSSYGWGATIARELGSGDFDVTIDPAHRLQELGVAARSTTPDVFRCPSDPSAAAFALYAEIGGHESHAQDSTELLVTLPHASYVGVFGTIDPDDVPGNLGDGAFIEGRGHRFEEFARGLSHVLLVGERTSRKLPSTWLGFDTRGEDAAGRVVGFADLGPNRDDADECEFDSRHPGHINVLWADGHTASIADDIDRLVYRQSAQRR